MGDIESISGVRGGPTLFGRHLDTGCAQCLRRRQPCRRIWRRAGGRARDTWGVFSRYVSCRQSSRRDACRSGSTSSAVRAVRLRPTERLGHVSVTSGAVWTGRGATRRVTKCVSRTALTILDTVSVCDSVRAGRRSWQADETLGAASSWEVPGKLTAAVAREILTLPGFRSSSGR